MSSFASNTLTAIIASGASITAPIIIGDDAVVGVVVGANTVTFQGSMDNVTYYNIYTSDSPSAEYSVAGAAGALHTVDLNLFLAPRWVKVRVGTAASPSAVSVATTMQVITKEI